MSKLNLRCACTITISEDERERVPTTEGGDGWTTRATGRTVHHDVQLWIDADAILAALAWKAARSKGKKAKIMRGCIEARAVATRYTTKEE